MTIMTAVQPTSLAEHLALAEQAAEAPRERAGTLAAALKTAIDAGQFDTAHQRQGELAAAREEAAIADAAVAALRDGAERIERQHAADAAAINAGRQAALAEQDLAAAQADEARRTDQVAQALDLMWAAVAEAQRHLRSAEAFEVAINRARVAAIDARRRRGDWPPSHPGPTPSRPNTTAVLTDRHDLIRHLATWSP